MSLPHTRDFTRCGCTVGARLVTYRQLEEYYICDECGGNIVHIIQRRDGQTVDFAECADCRGRDFVSLRRYEHQIAEWPDIVAGLPDDLKEVLAPVLIEDAGRAIENKARDAAIPVDNKVRLKRLAPSTTPLRGRLFKTAPQAIDELYGL
jgi:hypothetical protein